MTQKILYPYAYNHEGRSVPIWKAVRKVPYSCVGCRNPMIARLGKINKHHFAHKMNNTCRADYALHETAKILFKETFEDLKRNGLPYTFSVKCQDCKYMVNHDLNSNTSTIREDFELYDGIKPDLIIFGENSKTIIEIVVEDGLEKEKKSKYKTIDIPIIKIRPTWKELIKPGGGINIRCDKCAERKEDLDDLITPTKSERSFREITSDKYGNMLDGITKENVNKYGKILNNHGFVQQNSRPTLFRYETSDWSIYADLDSTSAVKITSVDGEPAIYTFNKRKSEYDCRPDCRECVLRLTKEKINELGVKTRRYSPDDIIHHHY